MDIKTQKLHEKLSKARAARKPKPKERRNKAVSITLLPEHHAALMVIGKGNMSKAVRIICERFGIHKNISTDPENKQNQTQQATINEII